MNRSSRREVFFFGFKGLVFVVLVTATWLAVRANVLEAMMTQPVVFCLLLDCFLIHVFTAASRREAMLTVGLAVVGVVIWSFSHPVASGLWKLVGTTGASLGLASLFVLSVSALMLRGTAGMQKLQAFGRSSIFLCMGVWSIPFLSVADSVLPGKLDALLYRFDAGFGVSPSFLLGRGFAAVPHFSDFELGLYLFLALPVGLIYLGHLRRPEWPVDILQAFLSNAVIGYILFWIFPAAGPIFAFPHYPWNEPVWSSVPLAPMLLSAMPNAMPSVHVSTALLVWFNARPWKWVRTAALAFLILTILSTLGLGQHYLIDVVVAFPYALTIQSLAAGGKGRSATIWAGALMTAGWLILLRFGSALLPSPFLAYVACPLTTGLTLWLEAKFAKVIYPREGLVELTAGALSASSAEPCS